MGAGQGGVKDATRFARITRAGELDVLCSICHDAVGSADRVCLRIEQCSLPPYHWQKVEPLLTPTEARQLAAALVARADEIEGQATPASPEDDGPPEYDYGSWPGSVAAAKERERLRRR